MKVGKTLEVSNRKEWRAWLRAHHNDRDEVWLVFYKKASGKQTIPYDHAVEEALCYGWIDSVVKKLDENRRAQRFSPRKPKSQLSETNKERIRRLIKSRKMTKAGLAAVQGQLDEKFSIAPDIIRALKKDPATWKNFQRFPQSYKRIRIGWIEMARKRPDVFESRLRYFVKMTAQNKTYGMVK